MIEVTFRMRASKAEGSKSISNEVFEVEEMGSSEVSFWSFMFDFIILSWNIFDLDSNLDFCRWMNFDSNEIPDADMEDEQRDELEVSELELLSSFSIEETDAMDETLGSLWKGMPLVEGHLFSNDEMDGWISSAVEWIDETLDFLSD